VAHLTDADGTPILQAGFFNHGEWSGCVKPLIPEVPVHHFVGWLPLFMNGVSGCLVKDMGTMPKKNAEGV